MSRVIGLTGGIASGKSLVSHTLVGFGMMVIDADDIGRKIMENDIKTKRRVVKTFGEEILREDHEIDRKKLAMIIFSDPKKRELLESMLHPFIKREMRKKALESSGDIVLEVPLLIEKGEHKRMDLVVVVYTSRDEQLRRLTSREGISMEEGIRRIATQLPLDEKISVAHYIINNSGSVEETVEQVYRFHQILKEEKVP